MRSTTFIKNVNGSIDDTPLARVYKMCEDKGTGGYRYIKRNLDNPVKDVLVDVKQKMLESTTSKASTYKVMNPNLSVHGVYNSKVCIDERKRIVFTKFRTSSHSLKIETGRWARISAEDRLCDCDQGVQDEHHVVFKCERTATIREKYAVNETRYGSLSDLMENHDAVQLVDFIDECMKQF